MSKRHVKGSSVVFVEGNIKGMTLGRCYEVLASNGYYTEIINDFGDPKEYMSRRFRFADDMEILHKNGFFVVSRYDTEKKRFLHYGPFTVDATAHSMAKEAFPDGEWMVIEVMPTKDMKDGV